jgi:hypothetical protein
MADFSWEITENVGVLSENPKGWKKELNLVSWSKREPKFDIRLWSPDHETMNKGLTFTIEEMKALKEMLNQLKQLDD